MQVESDMGSNGLDHLLPEPEPERRKHRIERNYGGLWVLNSAWAIWLSIILMPDWPAPAVSAGSDPYWLAPVSAFLFVVGTIGLWSAAVSALRAHGEDIRWRQARAVKWRSEIQL